LEELTIAVICDDMTWESLQGFCKTVYLRPDNWFSVIEREQPDILFCEATWQGLAAEHNCWENGIAHDVGIWFENRVALKQILHYCKQADISTIFWNKEDPHSDNKWLRFTDTACLFDHICTTTEECIPRYVEMGHNSVHLLPFGYSPRLFYPIDEIGVPNTAVFLGSWYEIYPRRCQDTQRLLDFVLDMGIKLTIYDRCQNAGDPLRRFPDKYQPYIRDAVPYSEIRDVLKNYQYVINVNTETESKTMFARRVFEVMACGRIVISNESVGMRSMFPESVWYLDSPFNREKENEYIAANQAYVLENHTMARHITELLKKLKIIS